MKKVLSREENKSMLIKHYIFLFLSQRHPPFNPSIGHTVHFLPLLLSISLSFFLFFFILLCCVMWCLIKSCTQSIKSRKSTLRYVYSYISSIWDVQHIPRAIRWWSVAIYFFQASTFSQICWLLVDMVTTFPRILEKMLKYTTLAFALREKY